MEKLKLTTMGTMNLDWFNQGFFAFPNVPENTASGEIIIGSLYRELGLAHAKESEVGKLSMEFKVKVKEGYERNNVVSPSGIPIEHLEYVLETLVSTPLLKNQHQKKNKAYYFFTPIIPNLSNYSNVARLNGNPWNPGGYVVKMLCRGSGSKGPAILKDLRQALAVDSNGDTGTRDDIWSCFVAAEIGAWNEPRGKSKEDASSKNEGINLESITCPSQRFASDIEHLIKLKGLLTRKRWISILESYFRFILAIDVLWICHIQRLLPQWLEKAYDCDSFDYVLEDLSTYSFFTIGQKRDDIVKYFSKEYAKSSFLNDGIWKYATEMNVALEPLQDTESIYRFLQSFKEKISKESLGLRKSEILRHIDTYEMKKITGKPGRTNNISEFLTYAPGRRNTANESQSSYDQGYWYKKSGGYKGAPWVFEMGPASLMTMVYLCCTSYEASTISVQDFIEFMKLYGVNLNQKEVSSGVTGKQLRLLGLVIDSPDAEGGIVINQPFKVH